MKQMAEAGGASEKIFSALRDPCLALFRVVNRCVGNLPRPGVNAGRE
jgi:hypothetical protein